jgi:hypothetical protein
MNHIMRLQTDLSTVRAELAAKAARIQAFRIHLTGEKFIGFEPDGSRKDWISVADVYAWLATVLAADGLDETESQP